MLIKTKQQSTEQKQQIFRRNPTSDILKIWKKENMHEVFPGRLWPARSPAGGYGATIDTPENEIEPKEELGIGILIYSRELAQYLEWGLARALIESRMVRRQNAKDEISLGLYDYANKQRGVSGIDV